MFGAMDLIEYGKLAAGVVGLIVVIAVGTSLVWRVRGDARGERPDGHEETEVLAALREAYEAGELDEAEYRKATASVERGGPVDRG